MKIKIDIQERTFHFRQPAVTSRGQYTTRRSWMVEVRGEGREGVGECAPLPDLSCDYSADYAARLKAFAEVFERTGTLDYEALRPYPSMLFGLETAALAFERGGAQLFDNAFSRGETGIPINGLVWMGSYDEMLHRMEEKIEQGFHCIKLKIGAIDFDDELRLVKLIRERFSWRVVEIRLDANGAFPFEEALYKLELLSQYAIHSIEQPIRAGQWAFMAQLCRESPLPIALDEELIGVNDVVQKDQLLNIVKPAYIVLKPSLHGGMSGCREWIRLAQQHQVGSWITSALESNVGLNAIAQFAADVYGDDISTPQGLGTGALFTDNIPMPLEIRGEKLWRKL